MSMSVGTSISFNEGEYQWMPTMIFKPNIRNFLSFILLYTTSTISKILWLRIYSLYFLNMKLKHIVCSNVMTQIMHIKIMLCKEFFYKRM